MKKSQLRELVREIVGGYEPDGEGKLVRHNDKFDSTKLSDILMRVAKGPVKEGDSDLYSKEDVIQHIENNPRAKYYKIGVSKGVGQTTNDPKQAIEIVKSSPIDQFELSTYGQVIQFSAPFDEKHADLVRSMGSLD